MNVLQLTSAEYLGGGERHLVDLVRGLEAHGHAAYVGLAPGAALRERLDFLPSERVAEFPMRGSIDYVTARRIAQFAKANKVDIIHAHVARDYLIAAMASSRTDIPFVITRHVLFPMSRLHKIFLRKVAAVIAPSNAVAASLLNQGIFAQNKLVTVRHGLDPAAYPTCEAAKRHSFVVGSVGNLDPVKGFDVLMRAAKKVSQRSSDVRFEISGEDRSPGKETERDLRKLVSDLGLEQTVKFSGWSDDIKKTISGFDVFVSASRSESFGYAIADAMLLQTPVIATATEGAKEIISNESVGLIVPLESDEALAGAILRLLDDPDRRATIGESARKHIAEHFSISRMITETEAVYSRAVPGR